MLGVAAAGASGPAGAAEEPIAADQVAGTQLTIMPQIAYDSALVKVSGPNGFAFTKEVSSGETITVDLLSEPEFVPDMPAAGMPGIDSRAGWTDLPDGPYTYEVLFRSGGEDHVHTGNLFIDGGVATLDPSDALAAQTEASTGTEAPDGANLTKTPTTKDGVSTGSTNIDDFIQIFDTAEDGETRIFFESGATTPPSNWWLYNQDGDMRFREFSGIDSPNRLTIQAGGRVGIGTTAPGAELQMTQDGLVRIHLEDTGTGDVDWGIWNQNPFGLLFGAGTPTSIIPVRMIITNAGNVGIGVTAPAAKLHVGGSVRIDGDMSVGSSRTIKDDISEVSSQDVLADLQKLTIHSWQYKEDPTQARHIGPMAEDFHKVFGLGIDDKHLSPTDTGGVALAAVKALQEQVASLVAENTRTNQELATLREELSTLRKADTVQSGDAEKSEQVTQAGEKDL